MQPNQSILRAFSILGTISTHQDGIGVVEIAHQTNLHKSTVSRMLATLEQIGVVERLSGNEGFRLGSAITRLAANISYPRQLITIARPFLLELAQSTGETVNLCVPDGEFAHYIDQINSHYNLQIRDWTGYRIPMHASCDGKLFLAYWPDERIEGYLSRKLPAFSVNTITDPARLRPHLADIRDQGHSWTNGEYELGIVGVAVPVWGEQGQIVASLCVGGPDIRFPIGKEADSLVAQMKELSRQLTTQLRG